MTPTESEVRLFREGDHGLQVLIVRNVAVRFGLNAGEARSLLQRYRNSYVESGDPAR